MKNNKIIVTLILIIISCIIIKYTDEMSILMNINEPGDISGEGKWEYFTLPKVHNAYKPDAMLKNNKEIITKKNILRFNTYIELEDLKQLNKDYTEINWVEIGTRTKEIYNLQVAELKK